MMSKAKIFLLFKMHLWEKLASLYSAKELAKSLSFRDSLRVAYQLLYNKNWDRNLQDYAIALLYAIRESYPKDWNDSFEFDALLGLACDITYNHEKRYEAYQRAYNQTENPPPRLLIELARCCVCPGHPPISYDEAIKLIMKAIADAPYADGVSLLCNIYSLKGDKKNKDYWSKVIANSTTDLNSPSIEPKFLIEAYLHDK